MLSDVSADDAGEQGRRRQSAEWPAGNSVLTNKHDSLPSAAQCVTDRVNTTA